MQIPKQQILELLQEQGKGDSVSQADKELPDQVDTDEHAGLLEKFGLDPAEIVSKLGGGALGGKIPGL